MLKLLRRKSFRKSKDLTPSVENSLSCRNPRGSQSVSGQYRERSGQAGQSTHSLVDKQQGATGTGQFHSLDRRAGSRESKTSGRYTSVSAALGTDSVNPPEILQYARPPENLTSPVRESNGYLPETSLTISPEPGFDSTVQKLFLDSVVNGHVQRQRNSRTSVTDADCFEQHVTGSPEGDIHPGVTRKSSSPGRKVSGGSERLGRPASASSNQSGLLVRKTSQRSNGSGGRGQNETKPGRKSVMAVLRQSFRRSKKERPAVTARAPASHLPTNSASKAPTLSNCPSTTSVVKTSVTPTDVSLSRESSKRFDYSTISVASVRTGRTLTPSRVSIVSRGSIGSRTSELAKAENEISSSFSLKVQAGLKAALSDQRCESSESVETRGSDVDIMSASIKTVNPDYSMVGRSRTSPIITSPGSARPRCLPETPKLIPSVVPPIYANVQQQMASGNSRQMSGIAKILEENGNKRTAENGVQKSASVSAGPPAIPKPAARLSIRQKVHELMFYTSRETFLELLRYYLSKITESESWE